MSPRSNVPPSLPSAGWDTTIHLIPTFCGATNMKIFFRKAMLAAVLTSLSPVAICQNPQSLSSDFATPERSANLTASAGFLEVLGIKLGMPAETALSILKSNNPTARITFQRTNDYQTAWIENLPRTDPSRQFVSEIDLEPARMPGDRINIGLTIPPSKQVVQGIARTTVLSAPVAVANIVAGLRKKYGPETAGPGFKWRGLTPFDGSSKTLIWIFETDGSRVPIDRLANTNAITSCPMGAFGGMGAPEVSIQPTRAYMTTGAVTPCYSYVIVTALIQTGGATQYGLNGDATSFVVTAFDWPLIINNAKTFYAFLDQSAQRDAMKAQQQAQQRGKDIKY